MKRLTIIWLILLGLCLQACTEYGWVLWEKERTIKNGINGDVSQPKWSIVAGLPNFKKCEKKMESEWKRKVDIYKGLLSVASTPPDYIAIKFKGEDNTTVEEHYFYCLPGTIDPRKK